MTIIYKVTVSNEIHTTTDYVEALKYYNKVKKSNCKGFPVNLYKVEIKKSFLRTKENVTKIY